MIWGKKKNDHYSRILFEKINQCPYEVYFIGAETPNLTDLNLNSIEKKWISRLNQIWRSVQNNNVELRDFQKVISSEGFITGYNERSYSWGYYICQLPVPGNQERFIVLLNQSVLEQGPWFTLQLLCNHWKIESGNIILHASCIDHKGQLFLFSGPSGAGKSTIAEISFNMGDEVIDEDQVIISQKSNGTYLAKAWGTNLIETHLPIRAFIRIQQSDHNRLRPISQVKTARWMMEESFYLTPNILSEDSTIKLFKRIAEFARRIPGFTLEFRKSPDFWRLIDLEN
jgi:hypothetical protein